MEDGGEIDDGRGIEDRAVAVCNLKGGVGKSTIAVNLVDRLSSRGHKTLFVDLDPNGHASTGLGFNDEYYSGDRDKLDDVIFPDGDLGPRDIIYQTDFGFDIIPSHKSLETTEDKIKNSKYPNILFKKEIIEPLLESEYNYIVFDCPAYRGKLNDNALIGTENVIIPITPGSENKNGFYRMLKREINPIRERIDLDILAIVPNMIERTMSNNNPHRELIEELNTNDSLADKLPSFARVSKEEFRRMDNGGLGKNPKPGLRQRNTFSKSYRKGMPLSHFNPENDQIERLDELANIVETGKIENIEKDV